MAIASKKYNDYYVSVLQENEWIRSTTKQTKLFN